MGCRQARSAQAFLDSGSLQQLPKPQLQNPKTLSLRLSMGFWLGKPELSGRMKPRTSMHGFLRLGGSSNLRNLVSFKPFRGSKAAFM